MSEEVGDLWVRRTNNYESLDNAQDQALGFLHNWPRFVRSE
jgi:hypothetical protein